jgi:hypothetical protein
MGIHYVQEFHPFIMEFKGIHSITMYILHLRMTPPPMNEISILCKKVGVVEVSGTSCPYSSIQNPYSHSVI